MMDKETRIELKKIFDYAESTYAHPRESNQDNQAFINICTAIGKILIEQEPS